MSIVAAIVPAPFSVEALQRRRRMLHANNRAALIATELFITLNGFDLVVDDAECVLVLLALAAGELKEVEFAAWLRGHLEPRQRNT